MNSIVLFVLNHGYSILFVALFAHQIGLPIPGPLFLLAAGAVAARGKIAFLPVVALAVVACVLADWVWYEAGRRRGIRVLHFIHRISRDPDYHDRRAQETFARYGSQLLLIAKFVPGLDAVVPPLSGISRNSRLRFLTFDLVGAATYTFTYALLGYFFSHKLDLVAAYIGRATTILGGLVLGALFAYLVRRSFQRRRTRHELQEGQSAAATEVSCRG